MTAAGTEDPMQLVQMLDLTRKANNLTSGGRDNETQHRYDDSLPPSLPIIIAPCLYRRISDDVDNFFAWMRVRPAYNSEVTFGEHPMVADAKMIHNEADAPQTMALAAHNTAWDFLSLCGNGLCDDCASCPACEVWMADQNAPAVQCSTCQHWLHLNLQCANVNDEEAKACENSEYEYTCPHCKAERV